MTLRSIAERIAYAGMAPKSRSGPLCQSNRGVLRRIVPWVALAAPCLILLWVVLFWGSKSFETRAETYRLPDALSDSQLAALSKDGRQVEILEARVNRTASLTVSGVVRNKTGHVIATAHIAFELEGSDGSIVGYAGTNVTQLRPDATARFAFPIKLKNAVAASVLDISVP